jgi:hypothetical protein
MIKLSTTREIQTFAVAPRRQAAAIELILTDRMTKEVRTITATGTDSNGLLLVSAEFGGHEGQEFDMLINDDQGTIFRSFVLFTDQTAFSPSEKYVSEESDDNTFIIYE